jgi:hypothetical protein
MSQGLLVWVLLIFALVLFTLAAFGVARPRTHLGWLGAAVATVAALVMLWPPH